MFLIRLTYMIIIVYVCTRLSNSEVPKNTENVKLVRVNKCCEEDEIYLGRQCTKVNKSEEWRPLFTSRETGHANVQVNYTLVTGSPDCGHFQLWSIYQYQNSIDRFILFPDGVLRHYYERQNNIDEHYDYEPGKYCIDKKEYDRKSEFALVCPPDINENQLASTEFLMHNIVSPITHGITIICLLIIAIIYFVLPTLRDLTGNIITTICVCLIISQTADLIRLLTVFKSHISILIAESICYISVLAAFFWLNCLGYYIWKTFRSRNVFLRITDGKKYCYYCGYALSCTFVLGILAIFAHFTMDYPDMGTGSKTATSNYNQDEQIGSLGLIIFFVPVAFTVLIDILFFATTLKRINRMHTYGRIHHKLRHSFRMFLLLLLVMTLCWIFFLASFSRYDGLINGHIIVNALEGPLILYICIFNQKHVMYLLRKTCCYDNCIFPCCRPDPDYEWGDEMTPMNSVHI